MKPATVAIRSPIVCEDCRAVRLGPEAGWIQLWLEQNGRPPASLTYCPDCATQFDSYPDEVSAI
jgi:hypothetical protein